MAKVLVVDDEVPLVELLSEIAQEAGHQVLRAYNGQDGLALAQREHPDLVITDIMMPLMTGYGLLRALRADPALRDTPVVLISAVGGPPPPRTPPADFYPAKPFDVHELEALIQRFTNPAPAAASD